MADLQSKPSGMSPDESDGDPSPGSGMSPEGDDKMADLQSKPSGMSPEGDDESDGDQSPGSVNVSENDKFLPMCKIVRIMKRGLPPNVRISKDAKETMQKYVSEFIGVISNQAGVMCRGQTRQIITGDDLLWSMNSLGLKQYAETLRIYLQRYREPAHQNSFLQGSSGNPQFSQLDHQSSFPQDPYATPQFSQPAQQSSGSQVPNENSQVSQLTQQSSGLQVPNENSQVSHPAQQSSFSQAPNETPQDPNLIVPMPPPE